MRKALTCSVIIAILCAMLFSFVSCKENNVVSDEKLKYYNSNSEDDFSSLIKQYNKYCLKYYDESYQIEIVEFEDDNDLYTKMSTELMAGAGPDIVSLNQKLPFEKLIENGAFFGYQYFD